MVGVPTSNRCDNCRKRKKKVWMSQHNLYSEAFLLLPALILPLRAKENLLIDDPTQCDEQKPSCTQCIRSGWPCPGYKTSWKFVDEAPHLAKHYAGRKHVLETISSNSGNEDVQAIEKYGTCHGRFLLWSNPSHSSTLRRSTKLTVPRNPDTNQLGSALVYCLDSRVEKTLIPLRLVGSFFEFIPARLGRNAALDDAVSCLCTLYNGTSSHEGNCSARKSYGKSLASLRRCLADASLRMESETLCASILLQMCEVCTFASRGEYC